MPNINTSKINKSVASYKKTINTIKINKSNRDIAAGY